MVTACPACQEAITFEVGQIKDNSEVVCVSCLTALKLKVGLELVATEPDGLEKKVLLCLEGEATRELVEALLEPENFHLIHIPSEMEALVSADCPSPDIAIIDLDLNRNAEVDLCAEIRKNPVFKDSTLIVIGSMFEKTTRYRDHEPVFPGADAFIDRYSLQKELLSKIKTQGESLRGKSPPEENEGNWDQEAEYEMDEPEYSKKADCEDIHNDGRENAQQVAREVISDMMRCNEEKVEEGIRSGRFYEFLLDEIGESRRQYETQVSETTRAVSNYFEEMLEEKFKERKEVQDAYQPAEDAISSVQEIGQEMTEEVSEFEGEIGSPVFFEESLDDFEATELANEPMTGMEGLLPNEESALLEMNLHEENLSELPHQEDVSPLDLDGMPEFEEQIEGDSSELSPQEAVTEITLSPFNLDATSNFEEQMMEIEATSLVDEPMGDDAGFSLVDEPTADLSVPDLNPEIGSSESLAEGPQSSVPSGFELATEEETPAVKTAKRLARIIVSDIVIYNEKKVEEGLQNGQFFELLNDEIDEGRQLYQSRVDKDRLEIDYLQEALVDYVSKKTSVSPR